MDNYENNNLRFYVADLDKQIDNLQLENKQLKNQLKKVEGTHQNRRSEYQIEFMRLKQLIQDLSKKLKSPKIDIDSNK